MINIAVCGISGKMGRNIISVIESREDTAVCAGIDAYKAEDIKYPIYSSAEEMTEKPDVIIDFSNPSSLPSLAEYCKKTGTPIVFGTTGYSEEEKNSIRELSESVPVFFTFNMSLGINLLASLAKKAAAILGDRFDVEILEKHHNQKIDAPSGTAIMLGEAVNEAFNNEYEFIYDRHNVRQKRSKKEIGMSSIRGGTIVGEHDVIFAGNDEVITLSHSAGSKKVFAEGAVNAAVYLVGKEPGMHDMTDLIAEL